MTPALQGSAAWLRIAPGEATPAVRLVCFAHAGGGASSFNGWRRDLPGWIELVKVQLPGREDRRDAAPYVRVDELIAALAPHVETLLDLPVMFYGHSVGSLIAYELTRALGHRGLPLPLALIISSRRAPHRALRHRHQLHDLPDDELVRRVQELGGIPPGLLEGDKWRGHFLPRIRADLSLSDNYVDPAAPQLPCPLHAFIGARDDLVDHEDWEAWSELAGGAFSRRVLASGHFFSPGAHAELVGDVIRIGLAVLAAQPAALAARSATR